MPTYENDVLFQRRQGNDMHIDYPATRYQNVIGAPVVYKSFNEVNASYTQATALRTVMTAMALNSELHANVTATTADYPAAGILHVVKTAANTASMGFDTAIEKYFANVTAGNIEQIFGGGGGINWKLIIDEVEFASLESEMANVKKSVADGKGLVATAISGKGIATTGTDTFATMAGNVDKIITLGQGTMDGNAIAAQILSGLVAYAKGNRLVGTMANNGSVNQSLAVNGTYTVPGGYHNGSGKVTQSVAVKSAQTYTPGRANQSIAANQFLNGAQTIAGSGNLVAGNIKQGVNIFGVVGYLTEGKRYYSTGGVLGTTGKLTVNVGFQASTAIVYNGTSEGCVACPSGKFGAWSGFWDLTISGQSINIDGRAGFAFTLHAFS